MSGHTETPWTYKPNSMYVLGKPDGNPNPVAAPYGRTSGECQANAAFIVRACNSHEALMALAERCASLNEHNPEIGAGMLMQIVTEAREALKLAKP